MKQPDDERRAFANVDEALRSYPVAAAPSGLRLAVLVQVRAHAPAARPRFQVPWIDYAISMFATGMATLAFLVWKLVPPQTLHYLFVRLQLEALLIAWQIEAARVLPALTVSALLVLAAFVAAAWDFSRSRPSPNR